MLDALTTDLQSVALDVIQSEITTLAAQINAATYRLLALIAELDRRDGWAGEGIRSCAHWLNWQIGINLGAAREKVRVARPDNEELLLAVALAGTAAHVEKLVRSYRRATAASERRQAMELWQERYLVTFFDDDGALVIRGKLPPEAGAVVMRALEAARGELRAASPRQSVRRRGENVSAETSGARGEAQAAALCEPVSFGQLNADARCTSPVGSLAARWWCTSMPRCWRSRGPNSMYGYGCEVMAMIVMTSLLGP